MRLLKVQGSGVASADPDMVTLSFNVEAKAPQYEQSVRLLNERAEDLRANFTASGLDSLQLKTHSFAVQTDTKYERGRSIMVGYVASHRLSIELPFDKEILNKVLQRVARGYSGAELKLSFGVRDKDALRRKAIAAAVCNAKENAETLAAAAGVTLGRLAQMEYGWSEVRVYEALECELMTPGEATDDGPDVTPAAVEGQERVILVYEILDG